MGAVSYAVNTTQPLISSFGIPGMGDERNTVMYGKRPVSFPWDYCSPTYPLRGVIYPFVPIPPASTLIFLTPGAVLIERGGSLSW